MEQLGIICGIAEVLIYEAIKERCLKGKNI